MNKELILASASPRRIELLHQIGLQARVEPSHVEEHITKSDPGEVVMELSAQKAAEVAERLGRKDTVVLGADTIVVYGGEIFGKPKDAADAERMLKCLRGNVHQVYTGVTVVDGETKKIHSFFEKTDVCVYPMDEAEIARYVAGGDSMDKAGAYGIQGEFSAFIKGIHGDYNNVVGLPVGRVYQELKQFLVK